MGSEIWIINEPDFLFIYYNFEFILIKYKKWWNALKALARWFLQELLLKTKSL